MQEFSIFEAASRVGRSPAWVRKFCWRGEAGKKVGQAWRFTEADVAFLESQKRQQSRPTKGEPIDVDARSRFVAAQGTHTYRKLCRLEPRLDGLPLESLSAREADVLAYLAGGWKTRQLHEIAGVGYKTIQSHTQNLKKKLGADSDRDLIRLAVLVEASAFLEDVRA